MTGVPGPPTEHPCVNCGLGVAADAAFCPHCAAPTGLAPAAPAPSTAASVWPAAGDANVQGPAPPTPSGPPPGAPPPAGFVTPATGTPWTPGFAPPAAGPQGPPGYVAGPPTKERMSNGTMMAIGLAVVLLAASVAYLLTSGGSDEESADEASSSSETIPTESAVEEGPLTAGSTVMVSIDADTRDEPRIHPLTMNAADTGTVVVSATQPFNAVVALVGPDGSEVATQGVALGRRGAAVTVSAPGAGEYEVVVSGFPPSFTGYTAVFRPNETFVTPAQTTVGDCVNRLEGEDWRNVNGFFVVTCDQPHEGQVFEQLAGVTDSGQAAHARCDTARNNRVLVPGFVTWQAYWGAGLTCVLQGANGGLLTGSLVST